MPLYWGYKPCRLVANRRLMEQPASSRILVPQNEHDLIRNANSLILSLR